MPSFRHGDIEIAYLDEGEGEPVLMVHGFASNKEINWVQPGWVSTLTRAGWRAIALDNRGHGASTKFYDPADYHSLRMAEDVIALLDHLKLERADIVGYSMGARITAFAVLHFPERVRSAVLGGLGWRLVENGRLFEGIAEALEAPTVAGAPNSKAALFRAFAEQTKSDLKALAACIRGSRQTISREELAGIYVPVMVAVGTDDEIAGSCQALADLISGARALDIPGRDHMLAVGDRVFKQGVLEFLQERT